MRKIGALWVALAGLLGCDYAFARPIADSNLTREAEALIRPIVQADQFSGTVLVARNGVAVFRQAYGLANRELNVKNTIASKYRIGSITKQFTAVAILQLQDAGKLSVDDPVGKFYADAPPSWNGITLRNLLTHTSGIPNYNDGPEFFKQSRLDRTPTEIIKAIEDRPLDYVPGSKFVYDNTGYIILGYIIEKVSGENYADYVQHHILDPLGMRASGYDSSDMIIPDRSAGYHFAKGKYSNAPFYSTTQVFSAGGLYSTVDDLIIWDKALDAGKLLSPSSMQGMFTDYGHGYGFGWFIDEEFGHQHLSHGGSVSGFLGRFDGYPKDKLIVIVLSNEDTAPVGHIADDLAAIYLNIPPRRPAPAGEALIRRTIEALRAGTPNYQDMGPQMAQATRTHIAGLEKVMSDLGPVNAVTLLEAEPEGLDRYRVNFQNGTAEWNIRVNKDGTLNVYPTVFPAS
jgi:D-alanyl-D-alanine carboxypeptidase